jgi:hypothetical protein
MELVETRSLPLSEQRTSEQTMAKLIEVSGAEKDVRPQSEDGFTHQELTRILGAEVKMMALNRHMMLVMPDMDIAGKNEKASRIAQFALTDPEVEIYGAALFVTGAELCRFLAEFEKQQEDEGEHTVRQCRSSWLRSRKVTP